jgi:uncharacterized protein (DUF983 family)
MNETCRQCGEPGYLNTDNRCDACHEDYVDAMADDAADRARDDASDKRNGRGE